MLRTRIGVSQGNWPSYHSSSGPVPTVWLTLEGEPASVGTSLIVDFSGSNGNFDGFCPGEFGADTLTALLVVSHDRTIATGAWQNPGQSARNPAGVPNYTSDSGNLEKARTCLTRVRRKFGLDETTHGIFARHLQPTQLDIDLQ